VGVGVIEAEGVNVGVVVIVDVGVIVGVGDTGGVVVGVSDTGGVLVGVIEIVGVIEGVSGGATTLSLLELAIDPCLIIRCRDRELLRNLTFSLCKSLLLGGLGIIK
jgi:hypothetical protein